MRVLLIQSEARQDGNALRVARVLRRLGHEAALAVMQREASPSTPAFAIQWHAEGFASIPVTSARLEPPLNHFPRDRGLAAARSLSELIRSFDVAWFFERHWAMPSLRDRRFRDRLLPLIALDADPDPMQLPGSLEGINRDNSRRYALRWADLVCGSGSVTEAEASVRRVEEIWKTHQAAPVREIRRAVTSPAVTVCVPYFEAPATLPQTLRSLEAQTSKDFTAIVVDDGSRTANGREAFNACEKLYAGRGWQFLRQANGYPGAARNRAARAATTEFLLFLDSDDIATPTMVERFLRAALLSGDDCLVVPHYGFAEDPEGPCALLYEPPGNSLIGSMADDMHGGSCFIVRREAFWSVGGFTEVRGVGFEDYEFHVRCNLKGLKWDVLPEYIFRNRMPAPENVSQSTERYTNLARVCRWYEERLRGSYLEQLPLVFAAAFQSHERAAEREAAIRKASAKRLPKVSPQTQGLRLLMLTCYLPSGGNSGSSRRVKEMVRYFGSRYQVTLVTAMIPEELGLSKGHALRYLASLRGVEPSKQSPPGSEDLPFRVRERYMDTVQSALRLLPTNQYHAALIDQIFMAEFRHDIDTLAVLSEHNIESRLLRQATERSWNASLPPHFQNPLVEAARLETYEDRTWPDFPVRAVTSEVDREQMDSRVKTGKTVVAPNGADPSTWLRAARQDTATVLFPGHLRYLPNIDAVQFLTAEIWPEVRKRKPRAKLIIAGRDPDDAVRAAAGVAPRIELCVNPKSMDRVARRASIIVAPLRLGSGTRVKILEAMAWGLPVVSTTLGCEGLDVSDGEHLLIRDDPTEFAEAIVQLMSDPSLWQALRNAARELVRERYSWDRVFAPLDEALLDLVS